MTLALAAETSRAAGRARQRLLRVLATGAVALVAWALAPVAPGLLAAPVLYVAVRPAHRRLARRVGAGWSATALLAALAVVGAVTVLALGLLLGTLGPAVLGGLHAAAQGAGALAERLPVAAAAAGVVTEVERSATASLGRLVSRVAAATGRGLVDALIAGIALWFLLVSGPGAWARTRAALPMSAAQAERLRRRFHAATWATLIGTVLSGLLQGAVLGTLFALTGVPHAAVAGALAALASALPDVGTTVVWIPCAIVLLLGRHPGAAVLLVAVAAVVPPLLDKLIRGWVARRAGHMHPLVTLLGAVGGVVTLGLVGLLVGPVLLAVAVELVGIATGPTDAEELA